jgi:membrane protease YdiL (CAAX protease family)
MGYFALFLLFSVIWGVILIEAGPRMNSEEILRGMAVLEVIDTILVLVALAKVGRGPLPAVSGSATVSAWLVAVPVLAALLGLNHLYHEALRDFLRQNGLARPAVPLDGAAVLLVCVQPAVVEELFFRYVAFGALYRATGVHTAVWVSAVMFAVAHIYNPLGMPYLFLVGAVLGYARVWGGLALPVVMHFFHNLAVLAIEGG